MNDSTSNIPSKQCTKCDAILPATLEYFRKHPLGKYGLQAKCRVCERDGYRQYYASNTEKERARRRRYYANNTDIERERNRTWFENNPDYHRQWEEKHANERREYFRQRRIENPELFRKRSRLYVRNNPDKVNVNTARYRARKRGLPDTFTDADWQRCLDHFNHCCAVCSSQLRDLFGNVEPHRDHWLPVSDVENCPGSVPTNMVCLCNSCNQSKGAKQPDVWLAEQYSPRKAQEIARHIQAYFDLLT